jgi:hypothetical protein
MVIVGNIISKDKITDVSPNFLVSEIIVDNSLPTLIIGWEETKKLFPETSILRKKIKDNLYWTFSTTEKRTVFENDLKKFIDKTYKDFIKKIKFQNIDPIILKINTEEELITKIKKITKSFAYLYDNKVVYIYNDFIIFSIDLEQIDFVGMDRKIILSSIKDIFDFVENKDDYKNELRYLDIRYLPYIKYKDATKNITFSLIPET